MGRDEGATNAKNGKNILEYVEEQAAKATLSLGVAGCWVQSYMYRR